MFFAIILAVTFLSCFTHCCDKFEVRSSLFPPLGFRALTTHESAEAGFRSGRAAYVAVHEGEYLFMYHTVAEPTKFGIGRWVINKDVGSTSDAMAYVDSWSVMPNLVHAVNDPHRSSWNVHASGEWVVDHDMVVRCVSDQDDTTIYLEVEDFGWPISGFYVQNGDEENGPVFSHVRANENVQLYLFKFEDRWIIGERPGVKDGIAFAVDSAVMPSHITSHWDYVREGEWSILETYVIAGTAERNVYASLRDHRSISAVPPGQTFHRLRNEVPLPSIGLGTGGIAPELTKNTMLEALSVGYRMFDMAREYGNEHVMGEILASHHEMEHIPHRSELFLISKVWPTNLGFTPTSFEISETLAALQTSYVDVYAIHWPRCDPTVEWMHCQDVVDQTGLWIESYMAITRAYAEGRVAAIGVSNFNIELLRELEAAASVVPHVVENFAEPGNVDLDVRLWCSDHATVYIPYASQRNIGDLPIDIRRAIRAASAKHGVSQHAVITRFFLQTGAAVIPRSSNPTHLGENIKLAQFSLDDAEMHSLGWPFAGHGRDEL